MKSHQYIAQLSAVALATSLVSIGALAQSSTQIYGVMDAGVTRVTGLKGGSVTQLASGIMEGSRWGIRTSEDLGGGYRALATIESRFELDTGAESNRPASGTQLPDRINSTTALGLPSALAPAVAAVGAQLGNTLGVNLAGNAFDRQSYVGLVTPVGAFIMGRQYSPVFEVLATYDTMKTESALSAAQIASIPAGLDNRVSNALQYRIQLSGLTASAMYGFGESSTSGANNFQGFMVSYKNDRFALGVGHNKRNNELGQKSLNNTILGASAFLGQDTISAFWGSIKDANPSGLSGIAATLTPLVGATYAAAVQNAYSTAFQQDSKLMHIGYRKQFGSTSATIAYSRLDDKTTANADVSSYGFAITKSLSKRTDLNFVMARAVNKNSAQVALGGNGYLGGVTSAAGVDSTSIAFGVRHKF